MKKLQLVSIELETILGSVYVFPDVDLEEVETMLKHFHDSASVTLVNVSKACLVLPPRIVNVIRVAGEERWKR